MYSCAHLSINPNGLVDKWCHSGPASRGNILISITGSKAYVTGDERRQLLAATFLFVYIPRYERHTPCKNG